MGETMHRVADRRTAQARTGVGATPVMSRRQLVPFLVFAAACYLAAPYLGLSSRTVDRHIAEIWPPGGVGFVLLTTVWFSGRRLVLGALGFMLATFVVTALAMGTPVMPAVWMGLLAVAQPLLMVLAYRRWLSHSGWAPQTPMDVAALVGATLSTSLLIGLAGGFPLLDAGQPLSRHLLWWVLRNSVFCFAAAATFTVIFYGRRAEVLPASPWYNRLGLLVAAVVCVFGTYHDPSLPLSWLLIIPSVWGGLTLTVRGTAYLALTVALASAAMSYVPQNQFGYGDRLLPASSIVDLLVTASTAFTLLLALMRDQRARLIVELDRRRTEAESQQRLLETVFESMNDGVMVFDADGVTRYNSAARQLLGRPIPFGRPQSWISEYDVSTTDGRGLDDDDLRRALDPDLHDDGDQTIEVIVGRDAGARVVDISAKRLGEVHERTRVLLLHDVTAQRARLRELTNFAGMVAHDLRGPLTVLEGWLEVLEDTAAQGVEVDVDTVAKAREASGRMGRVIEDWLGYTVVQNGQLRPAPVKLGCVTSEIVESRRSSADGEAVFDLDLEHSVLADPALLRQLMDNLVGNAVKYTPAHQTPHVRIASTHDREPGWVRVEVVDDGIGVPEGEEELIFEEFHRGPAEGRSPGTGLGLSLTRRIVALHGGTLSAHRNVGSGSTFAFTLPEA